MEIVTFRVYLIFLKSVLRQYGGVTEEMAKRLLEECGDDLQSAKMLLMEAFTQVSIARFDSMENQAVIDATAPTGTPCLVINCPICGDDMATDDIRCMTLQCNHSYCRHCLVSYVDSRMEEGDVTGKVQIICIHRT